MNRTDFRSPLKTIGVVSADFSLPMGNIHRQTVVKKRLVKQMSAKCIEQTCQVAFPNVRYEL